MLDNKKILKQAYLTTKANRKLWWFGLFLLFGGIGNIFMMRKENDSTDQQAQIIEQQVEIFFNNHIGLAVTLGFVFLIFFVLMIVGYYYAKAGTIISVNKITNNQPWGFTQGMKEGRKFFNRLLLITIFCFLLVLFLGLIFALPIMYLFTAGLISRALILLGVALVIGIPALVMILLVNQMSPLFAVSFNFGLKDSLRAAFDIISKSWMSLLILGFLITVVTIVVSLLYLIALGVIAVPFVILLSFLYDKVGFLVFFISTTVGVILFSAAVLFLQAMMALYAQVAWIIAFNELVKPVYINEEQAVALQDTMET